MRNIEELRREYTERIVDGMDTDTLMCFAFEQIMNNLEDYSDEQLKAEVSEYYPDLLEEYENEQF